MVTFIKRYSLLIGLLLLAAQFVYQIYLSKTDSQTTDEAVHLLAGYTYLTKRDFRFNAEHPPLVKNLAALPLLFQDIKFEDDGSFAKSSNFYYDSWKENRLLAEKWLYQMGNNPDVLLFWGRLPIIILTFLLGVSLFLITRAILGPLAAILALILYVSEPTINAHGHLITTDIAATLFYLLTLWFFYQFLQRNSFLYGILSGLFLGLALSSKFTLIILPIIMLIFAIGYFVAFRVPWSRIKTILLISVLISAVSYLTIWSTYLFVKVEIPQSDSYIETIQRTNLYPIKKSVLTNLFDSAVDILRPFLQPAPFFKGLFMVVVHASSGHNSVLLGETSTKGWWYYFPIVFLAKISLPLLASVAIGVFYLFKKKWFKTAPAILIITAIFGYLVFAMMSKANLGIRHILPIFPFVTILSGGLLLSQMRHRQTACAIVSVWALVNALIVFDYPISHYNVLFGGTDNGHRIATDSNFDWGQDIKRIKNYLDRALIIHPFVEYYWSGEAPLDYYKIERRDIKSFTPSSKGTLIIGASALYDPKYRFLLSREPSAKITPSVFVYSLNDQP